MSRSVLRTGTRTKCRLSLTLSPFPRPAQVQEAAVSGRSDGVVPVPGGTPASAWQTLGELAAAAPLLFVEISFPGEAAAPALADVAAASSCLAKSWHHRTGVVAACGQDCCGR